MPASILHKTLVFLLMITLCAACAPRVPVSLVLTATPEASSPAPTLTVEAKKTREPRQPSGQQGSNEQGSNEQGSKQPGEKQKQQPQSFPTSAYVPDTASFNIILGRLTDTSVSANLYALKDTQVSITYRATGGNAQTLSANLQANSPQTIELTGLVPDTEYIYQVTVDGAPAGEHTFHTQRAPGSTFTFTIDADPHNRDPNFNGDLYATTLSNALMDRPDFHINLGDTFMTEKVQAHTRAEVESTFTDMRPYFGILAADAPLFLVNGNHEAEIGWMLNGADREVALWATQLRQLYYPNPLPGSFYSGASIADPNTNSPRDGYYAWTWGDALFVVLDPFWYTAPKPQPEDLNNNWNWTLGKAQYDWLQSTLETSQSKYKFIFIHHLVGGNNTDARGGIEAAPFFEWGGQNADGSFGFDEQRPGWGKPIHQILVENGVSAVFHGHDHVYVKQELDGIIYQEVPQPSMAQYNKTDLAAEYGYLSGDILGSSGHLRVTVSPEQVTVEYVRAYLAKDEKQGQQNGQIDARYTISP
jgi:hypothetical protein